VDRVETLEGMVLSKIAGATHNDIGHFKEVNHAETRVQGLFCLGQLFDRYAMSSVR
jgi:hypothetical protein